VSKRYQGGVLGVGFNPLQAPNAPTIGTATKGNAIASVTFTAPANVGGSAISSYAVQSTPGGVGATGSSSPITVSGLTNDTAYTFRVTALNSFGPSPASGASNSVTPSAPTGWIGLLSGSDDAGNSVALDSSGNIYVCGYTSQGGSYGFSTLKLNNLGVIQWQRKLGSSGTNNFGSGVAIDTSGNVYACGSSRFNGFTDQFMLIKYDASGSLQWQRAISTSSASDAYNLAVDGSGDVYVCGTARNNSSDSNLIVAKYNSSGTFQSSVQLGRPQNNTFERGRGIAIDSSGVVYVAGDSGASTPRTRFYVSKLNAGFTESAWQQEIISGDSANSNGFDVVVNSSGDVYATGQLDVGSSQIYVCKFNSAGTIQWQRTLGSTSDNGGGRGIALDSASGDIYVCGYNNTAGTYDLIIARYNSSGALQWQRRLGGSGFDLAASIKVSADGHFYVCGYVANGGANDMIVAKLPVDGSGTNTYSVGGFSLTYAATTLTNTSTSYSTTNPGIFGGSSLSPSTQTQTDAASTLTSTTTGLS
jgi:uncharacterized delta-60 repeat protein